MIWRSLFDGSNRRGIVNRLLGLERDTKPRWGRMGPPQMVAHLTDQMRHCLREVPVEPRPGVLRWPPVRLASIYLVPWPKGRIQAPPEALSTEPEVWEDDVRQLVALVERFAERGPDADWPEHALFGRMTGRDWGVFVHKHFDYHLRQFGA